MPHLGPVSYTHLDVYKRQVLNGSNTITFTTLNRVWALAICLGTFVGSILVTKAIIGLLNTIINNKVPITLKHRCIIAALLAFLLAPIVDSNDVTHVPILSPYRTGRACLLYTSRCV